MISVITPVYNTSEKVLKRCFDSILKQSYCEFEVIIIDDGSGDACRYFLDKYCSDERFRVIHTENKGVCAARNFGIELSSGEYVTFVDSDDHIDGKFFEQALETIERTNADIVVGGINMENTGSSKACKIKGKNEIMYSGSGKDVLRKFFLTACYTCESPELKGLKSGGPWSKLIRRSAIGDLRFRENIPVYEDMIFNLELMDRVKSAAVAPYSWYSYVMYPDSAINKYRPNGENEQKSVMRFLSEYKKSNNGFGGAVSKKTADCVRKVINNTIYNKQSDGNLGYKELRALFKYADKLGLIENINLRQYPDMPFNMKLFYFLFEKKQVFVMHILSKIKSLK